MDFMNNVFLLAPGFSVSAETKQFHASVPGFFIE
jgi:hypothetical protein